MTTENTNTPAEQTFEDQVNTTVSSMTEDTDGNWQIPEDVEVSDEVRYAAGLEKRRRDTQAAFSKKSAEASQLEAENRALTNEWQKDGVKLTTTQQEELDELKYSDPDKWRLKLNEYESEAQKKFQERSNEVSASAKTETETERRNKLLQEYNAANPDFQITDDVVDNELPPKYLKQLTAGDITFEDYLDKAKEFLSTGKVIKGASDELEDNDPNFHKAGGGAKPSEEAVAGEAQESYKKEVY